MAARRRTAAVTGGARGIGLGYATALVATGAWRVALLDIDGAADAAAALSAQHGPDCAVGVACDVADTASFRAAWDAVAAALGPLDLFVNNAGIVAPLFANTDRQVAVAAPTRLWTLSAPPRPTGSSPPTATVPRSTAPPSSASWAWSAPSPSPARASTSASWPSARSPSKRP